jgi:hypothetical protein
MLTSTSIRPRALLAALAMSLAALLLAPGAAPAANLSCSGHTEKAEAAGDGDFGLSYQFGCSEKLLGYSVIFNQEIQSFEPEVPVLDAQGTATNELMSCEGEIPGFGLGCFGAYSAGAGLPEVLAATRADRLGGDAAWRGEAEVQGEGPLAAGSAARLLGRQQARRNRSRGGSRGFHGAFTTR